MEGSVVPTTTTAEPLVVTQVVAKPDPLPSETLTETMETLLPTVVCPQWQWDRDDPLSILSGTYETTISLIDRFQTPQLRKFSPLRKLTFLRPPKQQKSSVMYCHCIPRRVMQDDDLLNSLEWGWDMKSGTLNLDSHRNIFCAASSYHSTFDNKRWLLIPENYIINKYYESLDIAAGQAYVKRGHFPHFDDKTFIYKSVSLDLRDPILRQRQIHDPPFDTMPLLKSHLHPKFVIYDAGFKLAALQTYDALADLVERFPSLTSITYLYGAWTRQIPAQAMTDPSYNVPKADKDETDDEDDNDDDPDCDARTKPGRPGYRIGKGKGLKQAILSEVTLSIHNQQLGKSVSIEKRISEWSQKTLRGSGRGRGGKGKGRGRGRQRGEGRRGGRGQQGSG